MKYLFLILTLYLMSTQAQPLSTCADYAKMVEYLDQMKNEGLSKSEIKQNLTSIGKIKNITSTQINDWLSILDWVFKAENKNISTQYLVEKKKQECETERGIVNWNKD